MFKHLSSLIWENWICRTQSEKVKLPFLRTFVLKSVWWNPPCQTYHRLWYNEWYNKWYNESQRIIKRVVISANFPLFETWEEPTTKNPRRTLSTLRRTWNRDYWIRSRNKPLRRNKNQELKYIQLFCLSYMQL